MAYGNNLFNSYIQPQSYPQYPQQQVYYPQQPQYYSQQVNNTSPSISMLNGKIVDSEDMVRIQEIPLGGYGIYPKADMSNIFLKTWNNDGTTKVISYVPVVDSVLQDSTPDKSNYEDSLKEVYNAIERLEKKIDDILS